MPLWLKGKENISLVNEQCFFLVRSILFTLELPLPDFGGDLFLPQSSSPAPWPETPKPPDRQQRGYKTGRLRIGSRLWRSCQGLHPRGGNPITHMNQMWIRWQSLSEHCCLKAAVLSGCNSLVSGSRGPPGLSQIFNSCGYLEHWHHFCWACYQEAPFPRRLRDRPALQDFQVGSTDVKWNGIIQKKIFNSKGKLKLKWMSEN